MFLIIAILKAGTLLIAPAIKSQTYKEYQENVEKLIDLKYQNLLE